MGKRDILLFITFTGLLISVFGWYVDNIAFFPTLLKLFAREYTLVKNLFDRLDENEKNVIPSSDDGAKILLKMWEPKLSTQDIQQVSDIGRSCGIFNIKTGIHRYELKLYSKKDQTVLNGYIWNDVEAKNIMNGLLDKQLFKYGGWLFWVGLIIVVMSAAVSYFDKT